MSELVPAQAAAPGSSIMSALTDPVGGAPLERIKAFTRQRAFRRTLPWFAGLAALGGVALTWSVLAPAPQRILYSQLDDAGRASVVGALDKASITYRIDNATGALTVSESDLYRARMTVASDGALAAPDTGDNMLSNLPIGASRTLEGERMRSAKERELMTTIQEIDGVEAVRVHLAQGEKSAFIRDNATPSASVMLRMAQGRQLSDSQVMAVTNLVASSIPGLTIDAVKVIDQHGRLLTQRAGADSDRIALQAGMEEKLRAQVVQLLAPIIGEGNFSAQIQVELDMDQVTSARESYDKQGALRSEMQQQSQSNGGSTPAGVPGVLSNTPPPQTTAQSGAPSGSVPSGSVPSGSVPTAAGQVQANGESSATRNYELGREVAVANATPGKVKRLSVAVALSAAAMRGGKATDTEQIKQLVSAAVGADPARGDQVAVMVRKFDTTEVAGLPFYEAPWFASIMRNGVALVAVLLVLLLGVRPLIRTLRHNSAKRGEGEIGAASAASGRYAVSALPPVAIDPEILGQQVSLAKRMVEEEPGSAVIALRKMLQTQGLETAR